MEFWFKNRVGLQDANHCDYNLTFQCVHVTVVVSKSSSVKYSECFVLEFSMQQATHTRLIIFPSISVCRIF